MLILGIIVLGMGAGALAQLIVPTHGRVDWGAALSSNLLLPVVLLVAVWGWLAWVRPSFPRIGTTLPTWVWPALAGVAVAFGVLRNLPVDALQTLAP